MKTPIYAAVEALIRPSLAADRRQRTEDFRAAMREAVAPLERTMVQPNPQPTTRDLGNAALVKLALGDGGLHDGVDRELAG